MNTFNRFFNLSQHFNVVRSETSQLLQQLLSIPKPFSMYGNCANSAFSINVDGVRVKLKTPNAFSVAASGGHWVVMKNRGQVFMNWTALYCSRF